MSIVTNLVSPSTAKAAVFVARGLVQSNMQNPPSAISQMILVGRGGAAAAAAIASAATSPALNLTGGGGLSSPSATTTSDGSLTLFGTVIPPEARAVFSMAVSMALHYLGYSLARPTTLALFTSTKGFADYPAAYPLAMGLVSPTSLLLLMAYGRLLHNRGPRAALKTTAVYCSAVLCGAAGVIAYLETRGSEPKFVPLLLKAVVGALFIFRESYVQLITSQQWSFMASVLTPSQSSRWFAPISGLTSLSSAIAGLGVSRLVEMVGLTGVLCGAGLALLLSTLLAERAYRISDKYGFNPVEEKDVEKKVKVSDRKKSGKGDAMQKMKENGMIKEATELFARVPILGALFVEILGCQGLSTLLNVCFVRKLSTSIPDDAERAGWMGNFFASINVVSSVLQFAVLPPVMSWVEPSALWRLMPIIMVLFTGFQCLENDPSLYLVSGSFMAMKTMEFSVRRMLDEMVYVPLDFESRYVGKEIIGVFGYRFGKSGMSLALSGLSSIFGNFGLQQLSCLTTGASLLWLNFAWRLSNLLPTRLEAEEEYAKSRTSRKN